jgi:FKBP-type peptidyl-prolyl cis-trans isomerase FkpA
MPSSFRSGPRSVAALLALPALLLVACSSSDESPDWSDPTRIDFAPALGIDLAAMTRTASGLYLQDLAVGEGPVAEAGDVLLVGYTGWLPDGRAFDGTSAQSPAQFPLTGLIAGWQEGIPGMRPGGVRLLVIPPELAYGNSGSGPIPPRSTIVFRVELVGLPGKTTE